MPNPKDPSGQSSSTSLFESSSTVQTTNAGGNSNTAKTPKTTWTGSFLSFCTKIPSRILQLPELLGGIIGGVITAAYLVSKNLLQNIAAMLVTTSNYARSIFGAAVGTFGIIFLLDKVLTRLAASRFAATLSSLGLMYVVNMFGGPAVTQALMTFSLDAWPLTTQVLISGIFAGVLSNFQWNFWNEESRQESFVEGLAIYWAPVTMLMYKLSRSVLLNLGILQTRGPNIRNPLESAEILNEHWHRTYDLGKDGIQQVYAGAEYGAKGVTSIRGAIYSILITRPGRALGLIASEPAAGNSTNANANSNLASSKPGTSSKLKLPSEYTSEEWRKLGTINQHKSLDLQDLQDTVRSGEFNTYKSLITEEEFKSLSIAKQHIIIYADVFTETIEYKSMNSAQKVKIVDALMCIYDVRSERNAKPDAQPKEVTFSKNTKAKNDDFATSRNKQVESDDALRDKNIDPAYKVTFN